MKNEIIYEKKVKNLHSSIDISDVRICLKKCRMIRINTSAWEDEDFYLYTNLTQAQMRKVIAPILREDAKCDDVTPNEDLVDALKGAYPNHVIEFQEKPDYLSI